MPSPLVPARLAFRGETPYSDTFGDVYHSAAGGLAQARHVFLAGNGLPGRWAGRERFVILETGFGFGLNFLATLHAWRRDPQRCGRLHYVAVERDPFSLEDLRTLHGSYPQLAEEAAMLHSAWPILVPGGHRAELERGTVILTLFFADIRVLRELRLGADAIYLDGFAPARNPDMWSHALMRSVSRLAARDATVATWSVAAQVRGALHSAGFSVEKRSGFASKSEMLAGVNQRNGLETKSPQGKRASVVGAGMAGAAICERLCARGWAVTLHERHAAPAQEASGNHAGTFHPIVTPDDSVFARLTRAAFFLSLRRWRTLEALRWDPCGVLQLARTDKEELSQRRALAELALPPEYARYVTAQEATTHAGVPLAAPGLWFPEGGWLEPRSLVEELLAACGDRLTRVFGHSVAPLGKEAREAPVILATADDALHPVPHARLRRVRGQVTYLPAGRLDAPQLVVLRGGFVLPPVEGLCVTGASFDIEDADPQVRESSHAGNLERLRQILPASSLEETSSLQGRVGFRSVAPDRLPLVGRLEEDLYCALAFGSRGLIWSSLAAELIAAQLEREPLPLEGKLVEALDPLRFSRRAAARGSRP